MNENQPHQLEGFRKHLLNRLTATPEISKYIENCLSNEVKDAKHTYHKIIIQRWPESSESLFQTLSDYYSTSFIPLGYTKQKRNIVSFYTCSLNLVKQIMKLDFIFPYKRNMYSVDILFNDKNSADCFGRRITIEDIVSGIVSNRFNNKFHLDLSNFTEDPDLVQHEINFYKLSLLSHFKILMIRMGKDTKSINLSNNRLSQVPVEVLNFFINGDLTELNLSNNNIQKMSELHRVSSKIEKLWLEGNPLCDELDSTTYLKLTLMKFPRLSELDGVKINRNGVPYPYFRNNLEASKTVGTKMVVDKFLTLYFTNFDTAKRNNLDQLYSESAVFTISIPLPDDENFLTTYNPWVIFGRNLLHTADKAEKEIKGRTEICKAFCIFPETIHDPSTFTVDVLRHEQQTLILVVDGIFKEKNRTVGEQFWNFRRTFVICSFNGVKNRTSTYLIKNEMLTIMKPNKELLENSFKPYALILKENLLRNLLPKTSNFEDNTSKEKINQSAVTPIRNLNSFALLNPESEDVEALCKIFQKLTQLKRSEVYCRLRQSNWDIKAALEDFTQDLKNDRISGEKFAEHEDNFSDSSNSDSVD